MSSKNTHIRSSIEGVLIATKAVDIATDAVIGDPRVNAASYVCALVLWFADELETVKLAASNAGATLSDTLMEEDKTNLRLATEAVRAMLAELVA